MATYVTSDLHGMEVGRLTALLDSVGFCDDDFLYILGDVIDREGDGGVAMLQWIMEQPNVELLLGNHEQMLLDCAFVFDEVTEGRCDELSADDLDALMLYTHNGGDVTLQALKQLAPERRREILEFLQETPLMATPEIDGQDFLLVHAGLENFDPKRPLSDYTEHEILWARPTPDDVYFKRAITVFGHTPTVAFGPQYAGRILHLNGWYDIDVGVAYGHPPALLRLDDRTEFYGK